MVRHSCKAGGWRCGEFRDEARWSGTNTCHCTVCGRLFASNRAADRHTTHDGHGQVVCRDPESALSKTGGLIFEKIGSPMWDPPHVWRLVPARRWADNPLNRRDVSTETVEQTPTHTRVTP